MMKRNLQKIIIMISFLTILISLPNLSAGLNSLADLPQTSEGVYGVDFNGIYTFDNYVIGSDPWPGTAYGSASIVHSSYSHAYVYEITNGGRYLTLSNDMSSNWKIESYICCSALTPTGSGCLLIIFHAINGNFAYYGYDKVKQGWVKRFTPGDGIIIQAAENWTSNTWMYWRIEFTASSNTWRFYINNTLLDTTVYSGIDTLKDITFDCGSWGSAGAMRIDSLCYSWHPSYYDDMIFDVVSEDTDGDGMPDDWETENGLDPEDDTDALIDSDTDGLLNLYEYGNSTDPQDADSDNDLLYDGPEVKTHLTDPNDPDSDNDGLNDGGEVNTYSTDPNDADSDNDLLNDGVEVNTQGTDPNDPDSDNDLLNDGAEVNTHNTNPNDPDSDDDTLNDYTEVITYNTDPNDADSDDDLLTDAAEINTHDTDPNDADSDDDLLNDFVEINTHGTDPTDADSDDDLLNDYVEINTHGTDPNDADSDDDGFSDKQEIDEGKDPNNVKSYPGMFEPERFAVFMIFIVLAGIVSVCGGFITKKQRKQRFMR